MRDSCHPLGDTDSRRCRRWAHSIHSCSHCRWTPHSSNWSYTHCWHCSVWCMSVSSGFCSPRPSTALLGRSPGDLVGQDGALAMTGAIQFVALVLFAQHVRIVTASEVCEDASGRHHRLDEDAFRNEHSVPAAAPARSCWMVHDTAPFCDCSSFISFFCHCRLILRSDGAVCACVSVVLW